MDAKPQRERLRAILAADRCEYTASVFDPLSARLAEMAGFQVGMFPGSLASMTVLGGPDLTLVTLTEFAQQAHRIVRASKLPLQVEVDDGFGNALNVMRTVQELENAGVAAIMLEDTLLPKPYGTSHGKDIVSMEEALGKFRAGLQARSDPSLIIVARSQVVRLGDMEQTIARARAYSEAGVDALFFGGIKTRAQLEAIAAASRVPIMMGTTPGELADLGYLASHKVRTALQGHLAIKASVHALHATYAALRAGTPPEKVPNIASGELMMSVLHGTDYAGWIGEFLGSEGASIDTH